MMTMNKFVSLLLSAVALLCTQCDASAFLSDQEFYRSSSSSTTVGVAHYSTALVQTTSSAGGGMPWVIPTSESSFQTVLPEEPIAQELHQQQQQQNSDVATPTKRFDFGLTDKWEEIVDICKAINLDKWEEIVNTCHAVEAIWNESVICNQLSDQVKLKPARKPVESQWKVVSHQHTQNSKGFSSTPQAVTVKQSVQELRKWNRALNRGFASAVSNSHSQNASLRPATSLAAAPSEQEEESQYDVFRRIHGAGQRA